MLNINLSLKKDLKGFPYKVSRIWFHCTAVPLVKTLDVFFSVAWLVTVAKNLRPNRFLIRGILCALRTKEIFNAYRGSTSQDLSTYQIPEHVAQLSFLEIRIFEGYPRKFLERGSVHRKGDRRTLFLHLAMLGDPGWRSGHYHDSQGSNTIYARI